MRFGLCRLMFCIKVGKLLDIISSDSLFAPYSLCPLLPGLSHYVYCGMLDGVPQVSEVCSFFFFFNLELSF